MWKSIYTDFSLKAGVETQVPEARNCKHANTADASIAVIV